MNTLSPEKVNPNEIRSSEQIEALTYLVNIDETLIGLFSHLEVFSKINCNSLKFQKKIVINRQENSY